VKKLLVILVAVFFSAAAFAQEFTVSGEAKTGVIWEEIVNRNGDALDSKLSQGVRMGSKDDAGSSSGRFRINADYTSAAGNLGFRVRLNWEEFNNPPVNGPNWSYGFGWGSFFEDQFVLSLGKLGASPWGTGGPEMWRELELGLLGGLRFEWKPNFVPGELNVGFVLNWLDDPAEVTIDRDPTLLDLLSESVIGVSYKNEWFLARAAIRLDSELDNSANRAGIVVENEGIKLVYRVEEYALQRVVPDLSVWALGQFNGLGSDSPEDFFTTVNWLFVQYAPSSFTAQIRFGLDATYNRFIFYVKPNFSYNFFEGLLVPSIAFGYANDFGENKIWPGSSYSYMEFEPKLQLNFAPGVYVAFSYYWKIEMKFAPTDPPSAPEQQTQWINLRAGITF
jgi:hypothetical protein